MWLSNVTTTLVTALLCAQGITGKEVWQRRQGTTNVDATSTQSATQTTTGGTSTQPSSQSSGSSATDSSAASAASSSARSTGDAISTSAPSTASDIASSSALFQSTSLASSASTATPTDAVAANATTAAGDQLPIEPKITPAIGLAGAFLILAGVALCLIGIKHDWLQVFLSTALLASLAVTVLIIYVMNPPVSDAVQGAYFVAALLTGVILGSVSVVFKEITDGLGCLLGGFCLAMWLLVLTPGGIIQSTAGRGILIGVLCLVCFSLSFSQYTRTYGLIACTAFAGAMITILGVDCFSRAGLKEFWLYLWNLNDSEFPLNTNTYPITRGIRVEIACTIVVFLFGLMSQFRIWKVVKEHRSKRELERMRDEESRDELEHAVGREVETNNERDRREWEAVYGEKSVARANTDSGVGSSVVTCDKNGETDVDAIEMADVPRRQSNRFSKRLSGIAGLRQSGSAHVQRPAGESRDGLIGEGDGMVSQHSTKRNSIASVATHDHAFTANSSTAGFAPGAPLVVPLPFRLPNETDGEPVGEAEGSVRSRAVEEKATATSEAGAPVVQPLSLQRLIEHNRTAPDARDADRASSIAATADDRPDLDALSTYRQSKVPSLNGVAFDSEGLMPAHSAERDDHSRRSSWRADAGEALEEDDDDEALERPPTALDGPISPVDMAVPRPRKQSLVAPHGSDAKEPILAVGSDKASVSASAVDELPPKFSKIAMTYRTNEWAKHIADADTPEIEEAPEQDQPGVQVDHSAPVEVARPVDVKDLQQSTAVPVPPPTLARKDSETLGRKPSKLNKYMPSMSRASSSQSITPVYAFNRSDSQMSIDRHGSSASLSRGSKLAGLSMRNSSAPLHNQPVIESPIAEDLLAANDPHNVPRSPSAMSSANLLEQRNERLVRRTTSTSFNVLGSSPHVNITTPSEPALSRGPTPDLLGRVASPTNEDDLTLNQRRSAVRRTSNPLSPQRTTSASNIHPHSSVIYDSHQPSRHTSVNPIKQSARLSQWRSSLQPAQSPQQVQQAHIAEEQARLQLLEDRRVAEMREAKKREERDRRERGMDRAMRSGALHEAHREAMRRMQRKANES
nr:hypothetical protein B0A51_06761 [Rachicladosporium sp. CCFEE 5018]